MDDALWNLLQLGSHSNLLYLAKRENTWNRVSTNVARPLGLMVDKYLFASYLHPILCPVGWPRSRLPVPGLRLY